MEFYQLFLPLLVTSWAIFNIFPTLYDYYYPNIENGNNSVNNDENERIRFNNRINLFWLVIFLIGYIYVFTRTDLIFLKKTILYLTWGIQLFVILSVFRIVFYSIVGIKKNYLYFSAQHNSMRVLSTTLVNFLFIFVFPLNSFLSLKTQNNSSGVYDLLITIFYFSLNTVFNFFIICIVIFFMKDISIYIKLKSLFKKFKPHIEENFLPSLYIENFKKNIWEKTYSANHIFKIIIKFSYSILVLISYITRVIGFVVTFFKKVRNTLIKNLYKMGIILISMDSNYIIALSARVSILISIVITFIIFKYESIISEKGLDVMEFIFTIFLLPFIFNEILKLRKSKS